MHAIIIINLELYMYAKTASYLHIMGEGGVCQVVIPGVISTNTCDTANLVERRMALFVELYTNASAFIKALK